MDKARGDGRIHPVFISEYIERHGVHSEVRVREGAWNTGWHHGRDFIQWTGSQTQKDALTRLETISAAFHRRDEALASDDHDPEVSHTLADAHWRLLRAETSCNFYWGEDWVHRAHQDLDAVEAALQPLAAVKPVDTVL